MEDSSSTSNRSSPITLSPHLSAPTDADPSAQPTSASSSLQNADGVLTAPDAAAAAAAAAADAEFGFQRPEMGQSTLVGTVQKSDRHVFLCYKNPDVWPSHVEAAESDRLPRQLAKAVKQRKADIKKKTLLTICEGEDGTESSNGDVLIFPDMIRFRRLTHFDVENFVEDVLVKEAEWLPGPAETLTGSYVFVCAHASRDRRCGICGPALIKKFKEEISARGLQDQVSVSACSHIGGHKYAGNVIIFCRNIHGEVTGNWYGYVSPDDVPILLEQQIGKGEIVDRLWRGQLGLSEDDQRKAQELRLQLNGNTEVKITEGSVNAIDETTKDTSAVAFSCCQGSSGSITCCQNGASEAKVEKNHINEQQTENVVTKKNSQENKAKTRKVCGIPTWFESWDRDDTYATLAVVAAVASVAVAYSIYKHR